MHGGDDDPGHDGEHRGADDGDQAAEPGSHSGDPGRQGQAGNQPCWPAPETGARVKISRRSSGNGPLEWQLRG